MVDSVKISDREELIYLLSEAAEKEAKSVAHPRTASATLWGHGSAVAHHREHVRQGI
jgi:hypothetical protein